MKITTMGAFLKYILPSNVMAITLAPFGIFFRHKFDMKYVHYINHEKVHWKQQFEMLIIFFYIWYVIEYFIRIFGSCDAYRSLLFEQEAYDNEHSQYLVHRKHYAWVKYIFKSCK